MIVITNSAAVINEINIIHSLFEHGLELLHVRKPNYSEAEMASFLTAIESDFRNRLVLHNYHHLSNSFGINRLHNPKTRNENTNFIFSTSTHSVIEFNALENNSKKLKLSNLTHYATLLHILIYKSKFLNSLGNHSYR